MNPPRTDGYYDDPPRQRGRFTRNRGGRRASPARQVAYSTLRAVDESDAYANLVLPHKIAQAGLTPEDAAFATELTYGTLRLAGRYDAIISIAAKRPTDRIDPPVLDALRLACHQLLAMRTPGHAAVDESVELVREHANPAATGFANGVLRQISLHDAANWDALLTEHLTGDDLVAARTGHPAWIVRSFRDALRAEDREGELDALLAAGNHPPAVDLAALPGLADAADLASANPGLLERGAYARTAMRLRGGDPMMLPQAQRGLVRVQDQGSQLVALALADAQPVREGERWLDLCAGPGGKTAILAAVAAQEGVHLTANEPAAHRARLVRRALEAVERETGRAVPVSEFDGRDVVRDLGTGWDRILVDAPCSGLGALRRRPEARWRKTPADIPELAKLQEQLLDAAVNALKPGGVVAYVTCSPHLAETKAITKRIERRGDVEALDAAVVIRRLSREPIDLAERPLGSGAAAQLWPHRHGTDAMFLALLRRMA